MNRKEFFKRLAVVTGAAILTPKVLLGSNELNPRGNALLIPGQYKTIPKGEMAVLYVNGVPHWYVKTMTPEEERFRMDMDYQALFTKNHNR